MVESKQCRVIVTCWNNHRSPINNSPPSPGAVYHFFKNEVIKAEMKMKSNIPYDIIIINHFTIYSLYPGIISIYSSIGISSIFAFTYIPRCCSYGGRGRLFTGIPLIDYARLLSTSAFLAWARHAHYQHA